MLKVITFVIFFVVMTFIGSFLVNSPWEFSAGIVIGALSAEWYYTSQPQPSQDRCSGTELDRPD